MLGFKVAKNEFPTFRIEKREDIYETLYGITKNKLNDSIKTSVNEIISNLIENEERATIVVGNGIIHVMIDKDSLSEEKIFKIKLSSIMLKSFEGSKKIKIDNDSGAGQGLRMIWRRGYDMAYFDSKEFFSIVFFKRT